MCPFSNSAFRRAPVAAPEQPAFFGKMKIKRGQRVLIAPTNA
ncbi:hypothetical protein Z947_2560 [Sulfitobacter geojensis]|nr:hypothetical protein Z947_2560 [Sulfitobacter geojensis]